MPPPSPTHVRQIFLNPRPNVTLMTAAELLGVTLKELKRDIESGVIVASSTCLGLRISEEELIAAAMRSWEQVVIEEVLGEDAAAVLPDAIRLVLLRVRVPRYQRDVLVALAEKHATSVDEIVTRELEDVVCAHAIELAELVPTLDVVVAGCRSGASMKSTLFVSEGAV